MDVVDESLGFNNICLAMEEKQDSYEVIVTKEQYDRLHTDIAALKETNNLLNEDNRQLNTKVYELSTNLEKSIRENQSLVKMEEKAQNLSRAVLRLSRMVMKLSQKCASETDEKAEENHESIVRQLLDRVGQLEAEKVKWESQRDSMEKDYLLLLQSKQKTIQNLEQDFKKFKDAIYISEKRQQNQIIKEWKLKPQYVKAAKQMAMNWQERKKNELIQTIKNLQREKQQLSTLVINERAIVDFFRTKMQEKQAQISRLKDRIPSDREQERKNSLQFEEKGEGQ